jgi:hypothetical protein
LPKGLLLEIFVSAAQTFSISRSTSTFFSRKTMRTLRTKGLVGDPISFMGVSIAMPAANGLASRTH